MQKGEALTTRLQESRRAILSLLRLLALTAVHWQEPWRHALACLGSLGPRMPSTAHWPVSGPPDRVLYRLMGHACFFLRESATLLTTQHGCQVMPSYAKSQPRLGIWQTLLGAPLCPRPPLPLDHTRCPELCSLPALSALFPCVPCGTPCAWPDQAILGPFAVESVGSVGGCQEGAGWCALFLSGSPSSGVE